MPDLEETARRVIDDQRCGDRRTTSWETWHGALFKTRRRQSRRDGDHFNQYLDWHGHTALLATLAIILLCFADAFLTTVLLGKGAIEVNVLMDWLIRKDIHVFTIVKMAVTGVALLILLIHFNFRVYKYISVRYLVYALVPVYVILILHELTMLARI